MINYHFQWKLSSGDLKGIGDKSMTKVTVEEDSDAVTAPLGYESGICQLPSEYRTTCCGFAQN